MNELRTENWNGHQIRFAWHEGDRWGVAKDVCDALGYENSRKALADHVEKKTKIP